MTTQSNIRGIRSKLAEAVLETLWPTRCAVCDRPGAIVCEKCRRALPYLDYWRACPRCGAAFGRVQCTECNPVMMLNSGFEEPPFASCSSALIFTPDSARIARAYKDHGERRLAAFMAELMANTLPPERKNRCQAVTFIPATAAACTRRGFDHAETLGKELAHRCSLPLRPLLHRPESSDQRDLSRRDRFDNMARVFAASQRNSKPSPSVPKEVILIDDVMTTGSTLFAASNALKSMGVESVHCVTFARV